MIDLKHIATKWQKRRKDEKIYQVDETSEAGKNKPKAYILDMFPYPSGAGLHVGHPKGYIATDVMARKKILQGYNVLHPMGFDTFGLGTENYAIKHKTTPQKAAAQNIATFMSQLEKFGCTYDRDRTVSTADPKFYKRTQGIFLKFYDHYYDDIQKKARPISALKQDIESGDVQIPSGLSLDAFLDTQRLAYVDYKPINRCPSCKTGLANEDLDDGKCERCASEVEQKPMKQRVLRITKYAERLLSDLDLLSKRQHQHKEMQKNRIGKSVGTEFSMDIERLSEDNEQKISLYTTRIDTIYGATFVVLAPEHPLVDQITSDAQKATIAAYKQQAKLKTALQRTDLNKNKTGVFTGAYAINPFDQEKLPIWIADYVMMGYGTGAIMAVPAHDQRDFEFATKYNLPIKEVVGVVSSKQKNKTNAIFSDKGILINSDKYNGMTSDEATIHMQKELESRGIGGKKSHYKIQDWVFSRQRYWGEPFPIVWTEK